MEDDNNHNGWLVTLLIIALVWAIFVHKDKYEGQTAKEWFNEYDSEVARNEELEGRLNDYQNTLREANRNIEEANSSINDAQGYAWEDYYDMGNALDSLQTVDTVSEP